jgi:transcriptional regulator with XRE-family HTH domain
MMFRTSGVSAIITASQLRAARALLGFDQRQLAERAGVSLPTIQRMEASDGVVRGVIETLMKVIEALEAEGIELIGENQASAGGGRGVRLREPAPRAPRGS